MIRRAVKKDASRIAEIMIFAKRKAYRYIFNNDKVSFNEMSVLDLALHYLNDDNVLENVFVYDDGIVKGMMKIATSNEEYELCELYVEPFFQGQGIGKALVKELIKNTKANNAKAVFLWVLEENVNAIKFYTSLGFKPDGERKPEIEDVYLCKYVLTV